MSISTISILNAMARIAIVNLSGVGATGCKQSSVIYDAVIHACVYVKGALHLSRTRMELKEVVPIYMLLHDIILMNGKNRINSYVITLMILKSLIIT